MIDGTGISSLAKTLAYLIVFIRRKDEINNC